MSCHVPDFAPEDDTAVFTRKIADPARGEEFVELLWQKGPFFSRRSPDLPPAYASSGVSSHSTGAAAAAPLASSTELFMEEDEMASWLYYPLGGDDDPGSVGDVGGLDPPEQPREAAAPSAASEHGFPVASSVAGLKVEADGWAASGRPPRHPETRGRSAGLATASLPLLASAESTVVDPSATTTEPVMMRMRRGTESRVSSGDVQGGAPPCEHGPASSSGVSCCEGEAPFKAAAAAAARGDERKRKAREDDDYDSDSEDGELGTSGQRRELKRSASARRARAAEVHNLSERRRRDRINEKMKALQQLIPRCHKTDKASMLDDAIEYMKSLQMQVQMLSICSNMAPMMFSAGVQQYMPSAGMGIPMGMGMGMEMAPGGLCHPMMAFPTVVPGAQVGAAHPSQAPPLQVPLHGPVGALATNQMRPQGTGQADTASSSSASFKTSGAVQMPNLAGLRHQVVHPQNSPH